MNNIGNYFAEKDELVKRTLNEKVSLISKGNLLYKWKITADGSFEKINFLSWFGDRLSEFFFGKTNRTSSIVIQKHFYKLILEGCKLNAFTSESLKKIRDAANQLGISKKPSTQELISSLARDFFSEEKGEAEEQDSLNKLSHLITNFVDPLLQETAKGFQILPQNSKETFSDSDPSESYEEESKPKENRDTPQGVLSENTSNEPEESLTSIAIPPQDSENQQLPVPPLNVKEIKQNPKPSIVEHDLPESKVKSAPRFTRYLKGGALVLSSLIAVFVYSRWKNSTSTPHSDSTLTSYNKSAETAATLNVTLIPSSDVPRSSQGTSQLGASPSKKVFMHKVSPEKRAIAPILIDILSTSLTGFGLSLLALVGYKFMGQKTRVIKEQLIEKERPPEKIKKKNYISKGPSNGNNLNRSDSKRKDTSPFCFDTMSASNFKLHHLYQDIPNLGGEDISLLASYLKLNESKDLFSVFKDYNILNATAQEILIKAYLISLRKALLEILFKKHSEIRDFDVNIVEKILSIDETFIDYFCHFSEEVQENSAISQLILRKCKEASPQTFSLLEEIHQLFCDSSTLPVPREYTEKFRQFWKSCDEKNFDPTNVFSLKKLHSSLTTIYSAAINILNELPSDVRDLEQEKLKWHSEESNKNLPFDDFYPHFFHKSWKDLPFSEKLSCLRGEKVTDWLQRQIQLVEYNTTKNLDFEKANFSLKQLKVFGEKINKIAQGYWKLGSKFEKKLHDNELESFNEEEDENGIIETEVYRAMVKKIKELKNDSESVFFNVSDAHLKRFFKERTFDVINDKLFAAFLDLEFLELLINSKFSLDFSYEGDSLKYKLVKNVTTHIFDELTEAHFDLIFSKPKRTSAIIKKLIQCAIDGNDFIFKALDKWLNAESVEIVKDCFLSPYMSIRVAELFLRKGKKVTEKDKSLINQTNRRGDSCLSLALQGANYELVKYLIEEKIAVSEKDEKAIDERLAFLEKQIGPEVQSESDTSTIEKEPDGKVNNLKQKLADLNKKLMELLPREESLEEEFATLKLQEYELEKKTSPLFDQRKTLREKWKIEKNSFIKEQLMAEIKQLSNKLLPFKTSAEEIDSKIRQNREDLRKLRMDTCRKKISKISKVIEFTHNNLKILAEAKQQLHKNRLEEKASDKEGQII